ncbi:MAG: hypothetical protein F4114_16530 [Rhodospirillaceae bacterium]|nr:hypothetical protein [Rhodospirillaceae bacterium]MYB15315.1 hypothetical protein [Rhodospirillaceae bacterium]MYI50676.1 hypothetical protein [Rhodospirillaceae bacterium]
MKIANVTLNGMNKYGSRLSCWLSDRCRDRRRRPDIVTLQKIGSKKRFPKETFCDIGYECWLRDHEKHYRGVAVLAHRDFLSRPGLPPPEELHCKLPGAAQNEARFLTVRIGNVLISSIYAPVCKPTIAPTVDWLDCLRDHVEKEGYAKRASLLCGDFNVPKIDDKSNGKLKRALKELKGLGFCDLYRKAHPCVTGNPGCTWGYREGDGTKGASRLHLILASESLARRCRKIWLDGSPNLWPRPDAPPLVAELDVEV